MNLCGINISCHSHDDLLTISDKLMLIVTVNSEAIVRSQTDSRLRSIINNNLSTIDGQIPLWLYRRKYKMVQVEKISGSDLIYSIPEFAEDKGYRVFLLGGKPESNKGAVSKLKGLYPSLNIDGYSPAYHPYPFPDNINEKIIKKIINFRSDIVFVGFGMGKQEFWEDDNMKTLQEAGVKILIGCGGSFEFASGKIKRAPKYIQNAGLEGVWRLLKEFKWFRLKRLLLSCKIFYYYLLDSK